MLISGGWNVGTPFFSLVRGSRSQREFLAEVRLRYSVEAEVVGPSVYLYRAPGHDLVACVEFPEVCKSPSSGSEMAQN